MTNNKIENLSFEAFLTNEKSKSYFKNILNLIELEKNLCPKKEDIFNSFNFFKIKDLKVVILGQDPYFQKNVAHGLSFSTRELKTPDSLKNIFKELKYEFSSININSNNLEYWARQGILLQNVILTTVEGKAQAHSKIGWEFFTENLIKYINYNLNHIIFVLWGNNAKNFIKFIDPKKHFILTSSHPSPFSFYKSFYKNGHFKQINKILKKLLKKPIDWNIF